MQKKTHTHIRQDVHKHELIGEMNFEEPTLATTQERTSGVEKIYIFIQSGTYFGTNEHIHTRTQAYWDSLLPLKKLEKHEGTTMRNHERHLLSRFLNHIK